MMSDIYYLEKSAVYLHGVFWVGSDLDEGKRQADLAASKDKDDHHRWNILKYQEPSESTDYTTDNMDDVVYSTDHSMVTKDENTRNT